MSNSIPRIDHWVRLTEHKTGLGRKADKLIFRDGRQDGFYGEDPRLKNDVEHYRSERDYYRAKLEQAEVKIREQENDIRDITDQLLKEQEKVAETKRSAHQMQTELDNKDLFLRHQATDEEILNSFLSILNEIKTWSTNFNNGIGVPAELEAKNISQYTNVAPSCVQVEDLQDMLSRKENKRKRKLFIRGWAAYIMSSRLFRTLKTPDHAEPQVFDYWLDPSAAQSFSVIESELHSAGEKNSILLKVSAVMAANL